MLTCVIHQVLAMCFVRKSLDWVFTQHELKWLDDIMPDSHNKEKEDKLKEQEDDIDNKSSEVSIFCCTS